MFISRAAYERVVAERNAAQRALIDERARLDLVIERLVPAPPLPAPPARLHGVSAASAEARVTTPLPEEIILACRTYGSTVAEMTANTQLARRMLAAGQKVDDIIRAIKRGEQLGSAA